MEACIRVYKGLPCLCTLVFIESPLGLPGWLKSKLYLFVLFVKAPSPITDGGKRLGKLKAKAVMGGRGDSEGRTELPPLWLKVVADPSMWENQLCSPAMKLAMCVASRWRCPAKK